ncbi:tetratricopeptide repeat protein [Undibacterium flavidum]|uniref:Tetratricopeptide repeat protein n=1 Tax=Undibacterium flavidum TaxID=2762297 RepID=A0ABR6Y8E7_9BURK|nr:tetratricopeptide repeat protein [Undibacterium flavidum]MBC3872871.1 tetratricopeptide repeat protein [Undibacterium flavidum]
MRAFLTLLVLLSLSACSTISAPLKREQIVWQDQLFKQEQAPQILSKDEIFELSPALKAQLLKPEVRNLSVYLRTKYFLELVYSPEVSPFVYNPNDTTIARKTWEDKSGNCISLTILAYAVGKALDLPITMQDVDVPVQFDRRGNIEFLSSHVNAIILHKGFWFEGDSEQRGNLIIDFEPQTMVLQRGRVLSEDQILSRFYNNLGAEYLAKKQKNIAYAYFKAALMTTPDNSLALNNLAQLYLQVGAQEIAESTLRRALIHNPEDAIVMRSLQELLRSQKRDGEAELLSTAIRASNEKNPHYWIGLGMYAMSRNNFKEAIRSFEKAETMASGFAEIHQNLAEAYMKIGDMDRAKTEIKKLISLVPAHPKSKLLGTKFAAQ